MSSPSSAPQSSGLIPRGIHHALSTSGPVPAFLGTTESLLLACDSRALAPTSRGTGSSGPSSGESGGSAGVQGSWWPEVAESVRFLVDPESGSSLAQPTPAQPGPCQGKLRTREGRRKGTHVMSPQPQKPEELFQLARDSLFLSRKLCFFLQNHRLPPSDNNVFSGSYMFCFSVQVAGGVCFRNILLQWRLQAIAVLRPG